MIKCDELNWSTISYKEEHDADNSVIYVEIIEEAEYRNGYLVRDIYMDIKQNTTSRSLVFIPK